MSESNTIIINTHPIKKITLSLNGKEYEIPAYMSINDLQLFSSEKKESNKDRMMIALLEVFKPYRDRGLGKRIIAQFLQDYYGEYMPLPFAG